MSLSRRAFVAGAGAGALAIAGCGEDDEQAPARRPAASDVGIVNFALGLEHLEADFYEQVVGARVLAGREAALAQRILANEREHVEALQAAVKGLGGRPVEAPRTRFEGVLSKGRDAVIATAAELENVGAAAYLGQAGEIVDRDVLASALAIHAVEARHAAVLNVLAGRRGVPDGAFATPLTRAEVTGRIAGFLA